MSPKNNTTQDKPILKIGQTLLLVLDNEKVIGTLYKIFETRMRLKDVRDYTTNEFIGANCIYYTNLIRSIKIIDGDNSDKRPSQNGSSLKSSSTKDSPKDKGSDDQPSESKSLTNGYDVKMSLETINHVYNLIKTFIYINIHDQKYFKAVDVIKKQRVIGVNIENVQHGRMSIIASVLSVITEEQIYIFDLMTLNGVSKELKAILTATRPMKVVHNSKYIHDYLKHNANVVLNNIFDTMLAYMAISGSTEILAVDEVVENVFNLPKDTNKAKHDWTARPLEDGTKITAAANVAFLLELHHTLIHEHLLAPFYETANKAVTELSKKYEVSITTKEYKKNERQDVEFKQTLNMTEAFESLNVAELPNNQTNGTVN